MQSSSLFLGEGLLSWSSSVVCPGHPNVRHTQKEHVPRVRDNVWSSLSQHLSATHPGHTTWGKSHPTLSHCGMVKWDDPDEMHSKCLIKWRWADFVISFRVWNHGSRTAKTIRRALCEMKLFWQCVFSFAEQILLWCRMILLVLSCKWVLFSIRIFPISQTFMYFLCWKRNIVLHNNWRKVAAYPFSLSCYFWVKANGNEGILLWCLDGRHSEVSNCSV